MLTDDEHGRIRETVPRVKQWLAEGRERLLLQHGEGSPGIQVCAHLTDLLDTVVLEIFEDALAAAGAVETGVISPIPVAPEGARLGGVCRGVST